MMGKIDPVSNTEEKARKNSIQIGRPRGIPGRVNPWREVIDCIVIADNQCAIFIGQGFNRTGLVVWVAV